MKTYQPAAPRAAFAAAALVLSAATLAAMVVLPEKALPVAADNRAPPRFEAQPQRAAAEAIEPYRIEPYRIEVYGVRDRTLVYRSAAERANAQRNGVRTREPVSPRTRFQARQRALQRTGDLIASRRAGARHAATPIRVRALNAESGSAASPMSRVNSALVSGMLT
jgi:hypothetical protein